MMCTLTLVTSSCCSWWPSLNGTYQEATNSIEGVKVGESFPEVPLLLGPIFASCVIIPSSQIGVGAHIC